MVCSTPGCDHTSHEGLFLHGRCHPESVADVVYQDGCLTITCSKCKKEIAVVAVARAALLEDLKYIWVGLTKAKQIELLPLLDNFTRKVLELPNG
jgi:hypothetical protein